MNTVTFAFGYSCVFRSLGRSREDVAEVIGLEVCSGVGYWDLELGQ